MIELGLPRQRDRFDLLSRSTSAASDDGGDPDLMNRPLERAALRRPRLPRRVT